MTTRKRTNNAKTIKKSFLATFIVGSVFGTLFTHHSNANAEEKDSDKGTNVDVEADGLNESSKYKTYTVKSGDSLGLIAQKFNMPVSKVKSVNNLKSDNIYIGTKLKVYSNSSSTTSKSSKKITKVSNSTAKTYTVKSGDYLSAIAFKYKTTVANIQKLNKMTGTTIYVGQVLKVSGTSTSTVTKTSNPTTTNTTKKTTTVKSPTTNASTYTVKSGDSLGLIASKYGTSVSKLQSLNNLKSTMIYVGQVLKVSGKASSTTSQTNTSKPSTNSSTSTSKPSTDSSTSTSSYTVKSGDSLGLIAQKHGISVSTLKSLNNLSSDLIHAGQVLKVNGTISKTANSTSSDKTTVNKDKNVSSSTNNSTSSNNTVSSVPTVNSAGTYPTSNVKNAYSDEIIAHAKKYLGVPYVWGGSTPSGFDCSGFVYKIWNEVGLSVSRGTTGGFFQMSSKISYKDVQVGDLIFFATGSSATTISHVSIYMGNGQVIHASGKQVQISNINNGYWKPKIVGYGRLR